MFNGSGKRNEGKWGWASYDIDEYYGDNRKGNEDNIIEKNDWTTDNEQAEKDAENDAENLKIIYTRISDKGRGSKVDQYVDNGDGGHSHAHWNNEEDFKNGDDPTWERAESNDRKNPSDSNIKNDSGCYLTTACMHHYKYNFDDKCSELEVLRWFRDNYCTKEEVEHYYKVAPKIVSHINSRNNSDEFYEYIYNALILRSIMAIGNNDFDLAHKIYTKHVQALESALHIYGEDDKEMQSDEEAEFSK